MSPASPTQDTANLEDTIRPKMMNKIDQQPVVTKANISEFLFFLNTILASDTNSAAGFVYPKNPFSRKSRSRFDNARLQYFSKLENVIQSR